MVLVNRMPNHRQKAQVLPLSLALLLVASVVFFMVFNSGRAVNEKINLVNAADASAYSGAQIAARHLNFMAYTNRAMIANEAAIGHLYSFQVEANLIGKVVQQGAGGGGVVGDLVRGMINYFFPGFQDSLDLLARLIQPLVDSSKVFTGMLSLMLDANNATFSNFQEQAYMDLIQADPNTGQTVVDRAMSVVANSYIERANAPITVNDKNNVLPQFMGSENQAVAAAALQAAGGSAVQLCQMILFATPGAVTGNALGSDFASRSQNCEQVVSGTGGLSISAEGSPLAPEDDGGLMIDAIRTTTAQMENATWIRDRNVNNYTVLPGFTADRAGSTHMAYNSATGKMNWVADEDTFRLKLLGIPVFTIPESGDAAANVEEATTMLDDLAIQGLRVFGLCEDDAEGDGAIDCRQLAQNQYDSIQRYAALDPARQSAVVTAFLDQSNCSDGVGYDESGNRIEGWQDNLRRFDEKPVCDKQVYAIGQAEVYFQRPDCYRPGNASCSANDIGFSRIDNGGSVEVPNLYNPFWHARLVATGVGGGNG